MRIHVGNRKTLKTMCGKPVARRWWVEHFRIELRHGVEVRAWKATTLDTNCAGCRRAMTARRQGSEEGT